MARCFAFQPSAFRKTSLTSFKTNLSAISWRRLLRKIANSSSVRDGPLNAQGGDLVFRRIGLEHSSEESCLDHPPEIRSTNEMSLFPLIVALLLLTTCVRAEEVDNSLQANAVSINQTAGKGRSGTGIYLGKGLVLTASHVVGEGLLHRTQVTI